MSATRTSNKPPHIKLPNFEPLPPDRFWNRVINNLLKPIFYLFFTLIVSIVVIPVYTIIENFNARSRAQRGERRGATPGFTMNGQPVESHGGKLQHFLKDYGNSYSGQGINQRKTSARGAPASS